MGEVSNLIFYLLFFSLGFSLMPRSVVPGSIRLAFVVTIFIFIWPQFGEVSSDSLVKLVFSPHFIFADFSFVSLLQMAVSGFSLAIVSSAVIFVSKLFASWLLGLVVEEDEIDFDFENRDIITEAVVLLSLYVIFLTIDFSQIYYFLAQNYYTQSFSPGVFLEENFYQFSKIVFFSTILISSLFFMLSLLIDFSNLVLNRYFSVLDQGVLSSIKITVLALLFSVSLFNFSDHLREVFSRSLSL